MTQADAATTLAHWHRLAMQVRRALHLDVPRPIAVYLSTGERLVTRHGQSPWHRHDRMLSLLLTTACDALRPVGAGLRADDGARRRARVAAMGLLRVHRSLAARWARQQLGLFWVAPVLGAALGAMIYRGIGRSEAPAS